MTKGAKIDGIAIRDTPSAVAAFLERHGNPYRRIGSDRNSSVQLAMGSVQEIRPVAAAGLL